MRGRPGASPTASAGEDDEEERTATRAATKDQVDGKRPARASRFMFHHQKRGSFFGSALTKRAVVLPYVTLSIFASRGSPCSRRLALILPTASARLYTFRPRGRAARCNALLLPLQMRRHGVLLGHTLVAADCSFRQPYITTAQRRCHPASSSYRANTSSSPRSPPAHCAFKIQLRLSIHHL
jgi:hypothetical protein